MSYSQIEFHLHRITLSHHRINHWSFKCSLSWCLSWNVKPTSEAKFTTHHTSQKIQLFILRKHTRNSWTVILGSQILLNRFAKFELQGLFFMRRPSKIIDFEIATEAVFHFSYVVDGFLLAFINMTHRLEIFFIVWISSNAVSIHTERACKIGAGEHSSIKWLPILSL